MRHVLRKREMRKICIKRRKQKEEEEEEEELEGRNGSRTPRGGEEEKRDRSRT